MSGPWEKYAPQPAESGPWTKYATNADPTGSFAENVAAGAGKFIYDRARGLGQFVRDRLEAPMKDAAMLSKPGHNIDTRSKLADAAGLPTEADVAEARLLDRPLMETAGGMAGNFLGGAALLAPTALIPGANTAMGAGIFGGAIGATEPVGPGESREKNALIGTAVAGGTQAVLGAATRGLQNRATAKAADIASEKAGNATRDAALEAGRKAGYVVPPASVKPGLVNEAVESVGGKIATAQAASAKNQRVTDALAKEYLGLKPDSILSKASLADAKKVASEPYRQIASLSDDAAKALEAWKQANFNAKMQWNYFRKSGNPEAYQAAQAAQEAAEAALNGIEAEAAKVGAPQAVEALKAARVKLAKIMTVESAMTKGGHVDANMIAKMAERVPMKDQLKLVADFAGQFPKAVRAPEKIGGMAHALRPSIGAGVGTMVGGPAGAVIGGATGVAVPWTVRQMILSGPGQAMMANPAYGSAAGAKRIADLLANPLTRAALPAGTVGGMLQYGAQ